MTWPSPREGITSAALEHGVAGLSEGAWHALYLAHARGERRDIIPFPDAQTQRLTNNKQGESNARDAIDILGCMLRGAGGATTLQRDMQVLDYGCGWGRITRLLPFYFRSGNITGVDVDARLIASAQELLPFLRHDTIASMQTLAFADARFDLILANSVFSHLSERSCVFSLGELARVLKPGGVLVISVLHAQEVRRLYAREETRAWIAGLLGEPGTALAQLERDGFIWRDTRRWDNYGIAAMTPAWLERRFKEAGLVYLATRRRERSDTHSYPVGRKR